MSFALRDVGLECFTLVFRDEDVGAVFATDEDPAAPWIASLDERRLRSGTTLPAPFTERSHRFASLDAVVAWLGIAAVPMPHAEAAA